MRTPRIATIVTTRTPSHNHAVGCRRCSHWSVFYRHFLSLCSPKRVKPLSFEGKNCSPERANLSPTQLLLSPRGLKDCSIPVVHTTLGIRVRIEFLRSAAVVRYYIIPGTSICWLFINSVAVQSRFASVKPVLLFDHYHYFPKYTDRSY